jgi:hypothetical protein
MKTDYLKQAIDFLQKTDTSFKCDFLKNDFHFSGDKEKRDIYRITLKRGSRKFSFNFGQSLNDSGFYYTKGRQIIEIDRKQIENKHLAATIKAKDYDFMHNGKSDKIHYPVVPNEYDVLACLTKYDPGDFEDFCNEFGYDTGSRSAKKTYKAVVKEWMKVCSIWNDEEIEKLAEIN